MSISYADGMVDLHHGDALDVLRQMPDASVDSIVTDPPYGLEFMGKDWDGADGFRRSLNPADVGRESVFGRASRTSPEYRAGSLYQQWCEQWAAECLRVLKPGGHLLAFGGTRTVHRLTCGIEDAGFEIRDGIDWVYASGFPKSLDVSKAIDKAKRRDYVLAAIALGLTIPGNNLHDWTKAEHSPGDRWWEEFKRHLSPEDWGCVERAVVGRRTSGATAGMQQLGPSGIKGGQYDVTAPATDDAARWQGWGTALKPAREPIVVARKPLAGTVAANVLAHGTGVLNIEACRVGRWPSNVVLSHAPACGEVCPPGCPVTELDMQSGTSISRIGAPRAGQKGDGWRMKATGAEYDDAGGASRFFPVFRYEAKAPSTERPRVGGVAHPTVKPLDLMRWLARLVTPAGGVVLDPFAGSGTTAEACVLEGFRCIAIERDESYLPLIEARLSKPLQPALDLFGGAA